jgi:hypothetical protein
MCAIPGTRELKKENHDPSPAWAGETLSEKQTKKITKD